MVEVWTPPISDAAVKAATGRNWPEWRAELDGWAGEMDHRALARTLRDKHGLSFWWAQMVSGTWEMLTGRRDPHERAAGDGKYQASGSKTIATDPASVEAAFDLPDFAEWGPDGVFSRTSGTPGKSINGHWSEGGRLSVWLATKAGATGPKAQISLSHENLETAEDCEHWKTEWRGALVRLKARLES
ncbi:hypothetical protein [Maricaulis maris]|uniref:Activator of Hsp90 ATPase-like protein n=1 Tax=Maricaulis maris TaxID=74318 RepID=A0A495D2H8_9PROT|nr:hypothetical protein [Maricaulis maris]RKQ95985.1 hypothetical protein C7435_2233 [Maricaulis maris]